MRKWKKVAAYIMCGMIAASNVSVPQLHAEETTTESADTTGGTDTVGAMEAMGNEQSGLIEGMASDIVMSGTNVTSGKAGEKVSIQFTTTGNKNSKKKYEVDAVTKVYPVLDESFPFVMDDEAYKVTTGTGTTLQCNYSFKAKDNLETGYYLVNFVVVYGRKATDGSKTVYDSEYYVNKAVNVKITGKELTTPTPAPEVTAQTDDVYLTVANQPRASYGQNCNVNFTVKSSQYQITSVVPEIGENFPFESTSDAYKVVNSSGKKSVKCNYTFKVKSDVATGYQNVPFQITYLKNGTSTTVTKTINVDLTGKKAQNSLGKNAKKSVPRVMVVGYTTDVKEINPNGTFRITFKVKNNSQKAVQNMKLTLSTANGEFLPISGASTAYVQKLAANATTDLTFEMKASAGLGAKSYPVTIKSEYEDGDFDAYTAEDSVSIPVVLKDRISLSEVAPPDVLAVGEMGDLSLSINNMGAAGLSNVTVSCKGEGIECEETFVGNIGAGSTEYANVSLTGTKVTPDDGTGSCKIIIKYENASGEAKKYTEETFIYVTEESFEDMEEFDEEMMMEEMEEESGLPLPMPVIVGVVAVAAIVIIVKVRKKRRLRKEEELMEDELL